ncbi:MAG: hypothetical protein A3C02_03630 [Candidatus Andersenbacteria bacterium RIFCSPHIGHO2_02_FULL_45_11]|uniref:Uncharacterized protein n=1 Tax=Candidatus Andersenbacteria bacterium RIFCSPHIGHO2_12_FULL_45_11 TaxID=1797281 RepID=A0A1G1X670_9BACT|nr:MAG: hypothetical protein A2805_03570 [Candidatus Andersenbacteria bacterium RIFCSPHIGHO2_01_FULL_46_36]OGY32089.1 MAG: hypothetical protein A3C02_03630 [Candidatus Andersenbacteria bacterium RIFCSPHIGHO2_02_FULL_45_11]OGY35050.1 MAG: hypothetical protein A3D99_00735 [Candidatus Andersenbacteria bacterium RIFCSPHIGHO2_12_FULL_45_11]
MNKLVAVLIFVGLGLLIAGQVQETIWVLGATMIIVPIWALVQHWFDEPHVYLTSGKKFKYPYHDAVIGETIEDPGPEIDP